MSRTASSRCAARAVSGNRPTLYDGLPARRALTDGLEAIRTASSCPFQRIGCRRHGFLSLRDPARVGPGHPHPTSYEEISFDPAAIREGSIAEGLDEPDRVVPVRGEGRERE
jgi:hypothetical protein